MEKPSPPVGQTQMARVPMPTVRLQDVGKPDDDEGGSGGGGGGGGDDSDDDLIVQDTAVLSLRCPVSGLICKTPARTRGCSGLAVFDLDTYLQLNAKVRDRKCQYHACTKPINHKP